MGIDKAIISDTTDHYLPLTFQPLSVLSDIIVLLTI